MKKSIRKVAVLGSGVMGAGIACHFANVGIEVLLLDMLPRELEKEASQKERNKIATTNLQKALKGKPSPIYHKKFSSRITTGNFTDDFPKIKDVDWIIEVVIEQLTIKQKIYEQIEQFRTLGTLVSSNTSGIPIKYLSKGRSLDFQHHFAITHFFNPPRYLELLEIIPNEKTKPEVTDFFLSYGSKFLGKKTVLAKDTPAFIANRIGTFSIFNLFHQLKTLGLTLSEIDLLTGSLIGRPKSATFRTVDIVGLDTLAHVAKGIAENCPNDEQKNRFQIPDFVTKMLEKKWLGSKTKQGFYKKIKNGKQSSILELNVDSFEYHSTKKTRFPLLEEVKKIDTISDRYKLLIAGDDVISQFYQQHFASLLGYAQFRIPEIADHIYQIDDALKAGFGWQHGPFEIWNALGIKEGIGLLKKQGVEIADWVQQLADKGENQFYKIEKGIRYFYAKDSTKYEEIPNQKKTIYLENQKKDATIWSNSGASIIHLGDGVLNVVFQSKMNTLGGDVLSAINKGIDLAENEYDALVIGNQGAHFSVGANLALAFMMAIEQEYDELRFSVKYFQDTVMRLRYSSCPTLVAPHGYTFGGACELTMHADKVIAAAETYMGLVEFGVGIIPAGAGSKEMAHRASKSVLKDDVKLNRLKNYFTTIAMASVSTSAHECFDLGYLRSHKDLVVVNKSHQLATAKQYALQMLEDGYTPPTPEKILVYGQQILGMLWVGIDSLKAGNFASEHDKKIAQKLAYVMAGGDLSEPTYVSEKYLLELEREAFLSLCTEKKTLERIEHMLKKGKALRN